MKTSFVVGFRRTALFASASLGACAIALTGTAAAAQTTQTPSNTQSSPDGTVSPQSNSDDVARVPTNNTEGGEIVVTGTLFSQTDRETVSPVTTVTAQDLQNRGISTIQEGIQSLASNNGPALTNSFSANGAFAGGASAVSLRGLSTNSTLVLFDGLRAAYYPLADDATRNFVDLNTVPDDIVERIEVLRDGASSSYGADAIAGVVNIITKRQVNGLLARAEGGIAERGDGGQYRLSLTAGTGDIASDGYNAYISGFYYKNSLLYNSQRPYPYNTDDLRGIVGPDGTNGPDNRLNAPTGGAFPSTAANLQVRPYDATNTTALGRYQNLNTIGCAETYTLTAAQLAANATSSPTVCVVDYTNRYGVINPDIERFGGSGRVTATIGDTAEAYVEVNFLQSTVSYTGTPAVLRGNAPTGVLFPQYSTSSSAALYAPGSFPLSFPVYVCPQGIGSANGLNTGCNAANGRLNPNNPFAAQGQVARVIGRMLDQTTYNETRNRAYRAAGGIKGDINDRIGFDVAATAMHVDLRRTQEGYVYIANLLDSIAKGNYNFVNPAANTQAQRDFLTPTNITNASSDQVELKATLLGQLAQLPGGPLQLAVGGSIRYEAVDAPSANPDNFGPTQRYFSINAFGTQGSRYIRSAYAELDAPILEQIDVNLSGRYDSYTSGQDNFSPKAGIKIKPFDRFLLRGTYSEGFRIPSFGEANALPTTGYVTNNVSLFNNAFLAQYGCTTATFSTCPNYIRAGSYGQTTLASPNLEPEKSRSFTGGIFVEPIRNFTFSVDYYNIKKTNVITQPSNSPALLAYYTGAATPAGYTVIPDAVDPNFPNATPRVAFVQSQLVNANTQRTSGVDFGIDGRIDFSENIRFSSHLEASYIINLETEFPDGTVERYDGTLGNFNLTAGSGTPKWHGYWLNSLTLSDAFTLNGTVNYFGSYDLSAVDQGTDYKDGGLNPGYSPSGDRIPDYVTFDLQASFRANDRTTFSFTALNLFDRLPPIDVVTYGAHLYNPVQGGTGILGRYFKVGVSAGF